MNNKKKAHLILILLIALNVMAFGIGNYILKNEEAEIINSKSDLAQEEVEEDELFKSGWEWLNWSYSLLQYFRNKPQNVGH